MTAVHRSTLSTPFAPSHLQLGCNGVYLALPVAKAVGIWSLQSLSSQPLVLEAHKKKLSCLCFGHRHNPTLLCSAAADYVIVWNVEDARSMYDLGDQIRGQIIGQCLGDIQHCSFSQDDDLVAVCVGCEVLILDSKMERLDTTLEGHATTVTCAEFSPHHPSTVVSASEDRTFKIWDITRGCLVYQSSIISGSPFLSLVMNPNVEQFAVGTSDGQVRVYDLTEGNGFRCLYQLDVAKMLQRQRESRETDKNATATVEGPKTISSHPAWRRQGEYQQDIEEERPDDFTSQAGEAILGLYFTTKATPSRDPPDEDTQRKLPSLLPDESLMEELLDESPILIIGTPGAVLQVNTHSYELASFLDFQDPIPSGADQHYITISGSFSFAQANELNQTWCIIGSVFENAVDVVQLKTPSSKPTSDLPAIMGNLSIEPSKTEDAAPVEDDNSEQLTVISSIPLNEKSILRSEMVAKPKEVSAKNKLGSKAGVKKPSGSAGLSDQPLTFKSKIKSSGYTDAPRAKMFSPKTNASKTSTVKKEKGSSVGAASRSLTKEYPMGAEPPTTVKTKIDVGEQSIPINCVRFSDDGQNLACALANKSAQLFKMPLTGKGTSFTGHNAAVNSVHWSHSNQWLLTASDDKTARIWSKSASDPVLTLSHMDHSTAGDVEKPKAADKGRNSPFPKEIKAARFYYMDQFLLLTSGNVLFLYKYLVDSSVDDIKRYLSNSRYKLIQSFQLEQAQQITALSAVNGFHSYIVMCAGSDKSMEFFDMNIGRSVRTLPSAHTRPVHCICQNEGSSYVSHPPSAYDLFVTATMTDSIKLWDLRTNRCIKRFEGHMNRAHRCGVAISPCAKYIATGSEDKSAYIFDIRTGTYIHKLSGHTDVVSDVAFHPLYPELVTASMDGKIRLYNDR